MKPRYLLDQLQLQLTRCTINQIILHPHVNDILDKEIIKMHHKGSLSLMPCTVLRLYSNKTTNNLINE